MRDHAEGSTVSHISSQDILGASSVRKPHSTSSSTSRLWVVHTSNNSASSDSNAFFTGTRRSFSGDENDGIVRANDEEVSMTGISKDELNALLRANKAEVEAVSSAMKTEMANWREQMRSDLKDVKTAVERQTDKLDSNFLAQQTKLDAAIQIQTAKLEKTVSDTRLDIIRWVLGVPGLLFILWKIYGAVVH